MSKSEILSQLSNEEVARALVLLERDQAAKAKGSHYERNKIAHRRYQDSAKGREARKKYADSDKGRAAHKRAQESRNARLKLLDAMWKNGEIELPA